MWQEHSCIVDRIILFYLHMKLVMLIDIIVYNWAFIFLFSSFSIN